MFLGQDEQNRIGLQQLVQSDFALAWLNDQAGGWGEPQLAILAKSAEEAGLGVLPLPEVHQAMLRLRDQTAETARRTRERSGPSVAETQTIERLATAEWADLEDFADRYAFADGQVWLNRSPNSGQALGITDDRHIGVFCQTRGGKGVSTIIPQHCLWPGSLVSIDPSGENAAITAMRRGDGKDDDGNEVCVGMGQETHVLDPMNAATVPNKYRKRFNPLDALDPTEPKFIEKAAALADAMVVRGEDESEPVWNNKARTLIKGLILHIKTAPHFDGRRNLVTLRELATLGDRAMAELVQQQTGEAEDPFMVLFSGMRNNTACGIVISAIGEEFYTLLKEGVHKQWSGFHSALTDQTEFLESELLQDCLSSSDFSLRDLQGHPDGCSLYLCLPEGDLKTYKGWLRMMIYLIDYEVRRERGNGVTGKSVLMCVDEFAALGTMERIGEGLSNIAKFGLRYMLVLQDMQQLEKAYPKSWNTIMGSLSVKLFAAVEDMQTAEYVSKRCGETDLVLNVRSLSIAKSKQFSEGTNQSITEGRGGSTTTTHTAGSSQATTAGQSRSNTTGQSHSNTAGSSVTSTSGNSRTRTFGSSASNMFGTNASYNRGTSTNQSNTQGSSKNESFKSWKWFRSIPEIFKFMRDDDESESLGTSQSGTQGTGTSQNTTTGQSSSHTSTVNQSDSETTNQSQSNTASQSQSNTASQSSTVGESLSKTNTQNQSTAHGTSENWSKNHTAGKTEQHTTGETQTQGVSETIHKRPLITPDDVMLFFARGQAGDVHALGLGLLLVSGERPMVVDRTAYFADPAFDGLWCENPAYPQTKPLPLMRTWDVGFATENSGPLWAGGAAPLMGRWLKQPGERVEIGEPICEVIPGPTVAGYTDDRLSVVSPVSGVLETIGRSEDDPFEGYAVLGSIQYHLKDLL